MGTRPSSSQSAEQVLGLLLGVGRVEGLDPVGAGASGSGPRPRSGDGDVPVGVGDDGDAAGLADQLDRLLGARASGAARRPWRRAPGTPRRRGRGRRSRRPRWAMWGRPIESAPPASRIASSRVRSKPLAAQVLDDLPGPVAPLLLGSLAGRRDLLEVDPVAADVEVFGVLVDAGHLDRRHQLDPQLRRRLLRLRHPGHRIVIGRAPASSHPAFAASATTPAGGSCPSDTGRVALQLDQSIRAA